MPEYRVWNDANESEIDVLRRDDQFASFSVSCPAAAALSYADAVSSDDCDLLQAETFEVHVRDRGTNELTVVEVSWDWEPRAEQAGERTVPTGEDSFRQSIEHMEYRIAAAAEEV